MPDSRAASSAACYFLLMLLFVLACSGPSTDTSSGPPQMTLLSPVEGDVVCGNPLVISAQVENFTLTDEPASEDLPSDRGHIHLYLNGQEITTSYQENFEVSDIPDGEKQLRVELGLTNHQTLAPYVGTTIYITVDNSLCGA